MASFTENNGRLGNQFIRNIAVSLIAQKFDLRVNYFNDPLFRRMGLFLFSGNQEYSISTCITDENYFSIYELEKLESNVTSPCYYQTKEITHLLYQYLRKEEVQHSIIEHNPFKDRYNQNNDLFIHVRLGDVSQYNPGIQYYLNAIRNISYSHIYIATDSPSDPIIHHILQEFPSSMFLEDEITTFQFGSTCKHVLLSHGSFSAIIGYLSFFSTVYYPEYDLNRIWYGDIFSIPGWIKCMG